ncbi:MAG TPA: phospholipase, partial [Pararhizobium sp.]|nr:phospholipase [Pararhizobium sp.]
MDQEVIRFSEAERSLFVPGRNCWRVERAGRFSIIVDAADYFRAAKDAMLKARCAIYLIGWDFDTRIRFEPGGKTLPGPNKLGPFLRWLDRTRPGLRVHVLKWDLGALPTLSRGATPLFIMNWMTSKRVTFKLDSAHPLGAAHHQKIVVVDDVLAFCGGLDMTANRWDTRNHLDTDRRRFGHEDLPWHDSTTAVDGAVAKAIGELARERWLRATGEALAVPEPLPPIWPDRLEPSLTD